MYGGKLKIKNKNFHLMYNMCDGNTFSTSKSFWCLSIKILIFKLEN